MANYATLKAAVADVVKTNGTQAITGANLQSVLLSIINSIGGGGYIFKGVATPSTNAGTPDQNVFYIGGAGTYANLGTSVTVPVGSIGVFKYNGSWVKEQIDLFAGIDDVPTAGSDNLVKSGGVYPFSELTKEIQKGDMLALGEPVEYSGFDGVVSNLVAVKSYGVFTSNKTWSVYYLRVEHDCKIYYSFGNHTSGSVAWLVVSDTIPAVNGSFTLIAEMVAYTSGSYEVKAGQYICCSASDSSFLPTSLKIAEYEEANVFDKIENVNIKADYQNAIRKSNLAATYFNGIRLVNTMTQQLFGRSTNTKIGNFVPVSATDNTVTLSSSDAACIVNIVILSCKMSDGKYYNVYFSAAVGNVITKLYDFERNLSCINIVEMQCLHDTVNGGNGIHQSPYGYRATAQMICDDLNTIKPFSNVFVGGWTAQYCLGQTHYTDTQIRDCDGNVICTPVLNGAVTGGANGLGIIYKSSFPDDGPCYRTFYNILQASPNGASVKFKIDAYYPFKGFLRINCSRVAGYNGAVNLSVEDLDGNVIYTKSIQQFADSYIIPLTSKYYIGVNVIISMPDNVASCIRITEMTLHETYIETAQVRPIDSTSLVAMLGSSGTQFPHLDVAEELCPNDPDNVIITRPDGTTGDGCGYLGKQIARITGATVDNWGKSGERTTYGLEMIQKIFETKRYTHIILSLYANDINANIPMVQVLSNIRQMAEYAKGQGCVPIVIMGNAAGSNPRVIQYAVLYDDLSQGMDSPLIYIGAQYHS